MGKCTYKHAITSDKVVSFLIRQFSLLWIEQQRCLKFDIDVIESDWGQGANLDILASKLAADKNHTIKAICIVHNETATRVTNNLATVRQLLVKLPLLLQAMVVVLERLLQEAVMVDLVRVLVLVELVRVLVLMELVRVVDLLVLVRVVDLLVLVWVVDLAVLQLTMRVVVLGQLEQVLDLNQTARLSPVSYKKMVTFRRIKVDTLCQATKH